MATMGKGRVEAFSDGVIAVAITLLVLDLHVTAEGHGSLAHQLGADWPSYAAYITTFFLIGVIWVNHHALFALVDQVDRLLLFYNLVLLLAVTSLPFATIVLADYLREGGADARLAVVIYGGANEVMAIGFAVLIHRMVYGGLLIVAVSRERGRRAVQRFGLGMFVYPIITAVGLWSPQIMLVLYVGMTAYYLFEQTPILGREAEAEAEDEVSSEG
jgi:uncharacterized membrane protein